ITFAIGFAPAVGDRAPPHPQPPQSKNPSNNNGFSQLKKKFIFPLPLPEISVILDKATRDRAAW
ncbi:MAG TPA: hypothetical protein DD000_01600, partial [Cyanobacteria bacterium UBA11166]|nr:hypothetical protein [Cyanobacteria bacterium UBA11166]